MARILETNHTNSLAHGEPLTAIRITLGTGVQLTLATAAFTLNGEIWQGVIALKDSLTIDFTNAMDGLKFTISNISLVLGQTLINTPNVLNKTEASIYAYLKNEETGEEFLDEKIYGEIRTGDINGDEIQCTFMSDIDAAGDYQGISIADEFPDAQLPVTTPDPRDFNDIVNVRPGIGNRATPLIDDAGDRYQLPNFGEVY